jgi:hypothetical protein
VEFALGRRYQPRRHEAVGNQRRRFQRLAGYRQSLYFCTSKASKVGIYLVLRPPQRLGLVCSVGVYGVERSSQPGIREVMRYAVSRPVAPPDEVAKLRVRERRWSIRYCVVVHLVHTSHTCPSPA